MGGREQDGHRHGEIARGEPAPHDHQGADHRAREADAEQGPARRQAGRGLRGGEHDAACDREGQRERDRQPGPEPVEQDAHGDLEHREDDEEGARHKAEILRREGEFVHQVGRARITEELARDRCAPAGQRCSR